MPVSVVTRSKIIFFSSPQVCALFFFFSLKGAPRKWMFVQTCTGSAKPCDQKRSGQGGGVRKLLRP